MKYFEMWTLHKESVIAAMVRNMQSDLENGYDPHGSSIRTQKERIDAYRVGYDTSFQLLTEMGAANGFDAVERWCYLDLTRSGAIA